MTCGLLTATCGEKEDGDQVCEPGKSEECTCPGGAIGGQRCEDDGSKWGECVCDGAGDGTGGADGGDDGSDGATDDGGDDGGDDGATDTGGTTGGSGTGDDGGTGGTDTGGGGNLITLQNDGFDMAGTPFRQAGFIENECWASTYVPGPGHYPFQIHSVQVLIVESLMNNFEVGIYEVDANNMPTAKVDSVDVSLQGALDAFNEIDFATVGLTSPTYETGDRFAIGVCFRHTPTPMNADPSIASDTDGTIMGDRNWIFDLTSWKRSDSFFVSGDWIMRAIIEPM